jgi:GTPase SAR1 family protein
MELVERKKRLFEIMDAYGTVLERWNDKRKDEMISIRNTISRERYQIGLIGFVKRGKSTLLNALLGSADNYTIAPVKVDTCTAAIVKYFDAALYPDTPDKEGAIITFNDGRNPLYVDKADIPQYIDQTASGFSKEEAQRIDCIEIYGNFPLVKNRGVIIDTPGRGAIYDQDYLTDNILPHVDVIIAPIAADFPLEKDESDFLKRLPETEKAKLMFVLTKTDAVDPDELDETIAYVQRQITAIAGGAPRLYKVAAKKVLDAWKAGKTPEEVEAVKKRCGMAEFEEALDAKLRKRSEVEASIRAACKRLEKDFDTDKKALAEGKEKLSLDAVDLEEQKRELEAACPGIREKYKKNEGELTRKWNREVESVLRKLNSKEDAIAGRLSDSVQRENLFSLIGSSSKLARKIQANLQSELSGDLAELSSDLEEMEIGRAHV